MNAQILLAMLCTQLVFLLYGAGLRRPFGSLETLDEVPKVLRAIPFVSFDVLYLLFLAAMSIWLLCIDLVRRYLALQSTTKY